MTRYSPYQQTTEIENQLRQIESQYHTAKLKVLLSALEGSVSRTIDMLRTISEKKENDDKALMKTSVGKRANLEQLRDHVEKSPEAEIKSASDPAQAMDESEAVEDEACSEEEETSNKQRVR